MADFKDTTITVKALVLSRPEPCFLHNILQDYINIEGKEMPYRDLGYESPLEFLKKTGEFNITYLPNGNYLIDVIDVEKTKHIYDIANVQNIRAYGKKRTYSNQNNKFRGDFQGDNFETAKNISGVNKADPVDLRKRLGLRNTFQQQQIAPVKQQDIDNFRPILGAKCGKTATNVKSYNIHGKGHGCATTSSMAQPPLQPPLQPLHNAKVADTITGEMAGSSKFKSSVNDRLKFVNKQVHFSKKQDKEQIPPSVNQTELLSLSSDKTVTSMYELLDYCISQNFPKPQYTLVKNQSSYICSVLVNGRTFSTHPKEYSTEYLAKEACSSLALTQLKNSQVPQKALSNSSLDQTKCIDELYEEVLRHPNGVFMNHLPALLEEKNGQRLPHCWSTLVQSSSKFLVETGINGKVIVYAKVNEEKPQEKSERLVVEQSVKGKTMPHRREITLPWHEKCWNIIITHCVSTTEVWGRLCDKNYNDPFEALSADIISYMNGLNRLRPSTIIKNYLYLLQDVDKVWKRVQVKEIDDCTDRAFCFFVDYGGVTWSPMKELYECKKQFLSLPPQAVLFALDELEEFENYPNIVEHVRLLLFEKVILGIILTNQKDFDNDTSFNRKIQIVCFDTCPTKDINLNDQLLDVICRGKAAPKISENIANAIVTNISNNGDLCVQMKNKEVEFLQTIIDKTVKTKLDLEKHKASYKDLFDCKIFLMCDDDDKNNVKWYRVALVNNQGCNVLLHKNIEVHCVDFGWNRNANMSKIYLLENLSVVLCRFPPQAIQVRLQDVPNVTSKILDLMNHLLPLNCEVLIKLVTQNEIPLVKMYRRMETSGSLCTINDAICIEHELAGNVEEISCADLKAIEDYSPMPMMDAHFQVRVALCINPSNFVVQSYAKYEAFQCLMKSLQDFCKSTHVNIPFDDIVVGEAYAVKNANGLYHRAIVFKKSSDLIYVAYCDFGDTEAVTTDEIKQLPNEFRNLPKMAIKAELFGIKPLNDDWTLENCLEFRKLTVGKAFVSHVKSISQVYDKTTLTTKSILKLDLIDVSTSNDIYIKDILIDRKQALAIV